MNFVTILCIISCTSICLMFSNIFYNITHLTGSKFQFVVTQVMVYSVMITVNLYMMGLVE